MSGARKDPAPAVTRACLILDHVGRAHGRPVPLSELARELGIPKSSCVNVCHSLEDGGLLRRVPDGFLLGARTAHLGSQYVTQFNVLREFFDVVSSSPTLATEVVQLVMLDGHSAVYLARHDGNTPYRYGTPLGSRLPALFTASGTALLSELEIPELDDAVADALPAHSPVGERRLTRDELLRDLETVRELGYAVDRGYSTPGVGGVAVPLDRWSPGDPALAMGVAVPLGEMSEPRITRVGTALLEAAARLRNPWRELSSPSHAVQHVGHRSLR